MPKRAVEETFEQLKTTAGQAARQLTTEPGKVAAEAGRQIGGQAGLGPAPADRQPQQARKKQERARIGQIEAELAQMRKKRAERPAPEVKPAEENKILQLERKKPVELPPSVKASQGTVERGKAKF